MFDKIVFEIWQSYNIDSLYTINKQHETSSCFVYLLTSYASGKSAKLCKHFSVLISSTLGNIKDGNKIVSYLC